MTAQILEKNHFRMTAILISIISIFIFLTNEDIIPSLFKYVSFIFLILISLYFVPFQLTRTDNDINKIIGISSKFIFGISSAYMAILTFVSSKEIFLVGSIIIIVSSIFSIIALVYKSEKSREIFISHTIVTFFLIGLTKMLH